MRALTAFRDGVRRVNGAPVMLLGMFLATLLVALPLSLVLRGAIESSLGRSLAAETAASGVNYDWWQEFSSQATGLAATFVPSIVGFGAVLDNLSGLLDNLPLAGAISAAIAAWLAVWSFLSGGVIDRYARGRPTRSAGFFAACGTHFWRFLRLGVVAPSGRDHPLRIQPDHEFPYISIVLPVWGTLPSGEIPWFDKGPHYLNPLTYGVDGLRYSLIGTSALSPAVDMTILAVCCAAMLFLGAYLFENTEVK